MQPGTKLAHYEILSALGKGGMGEVWKAKDTKLGREVAIKTLPEEFAKDADRLARFEREAKLLASLNHPNIAAIYGLEESNGTRFLVLELVEGDTLADRMKNGAIPVEESLKLALQISEALEAAHEKGVVHRDLKPANIKVTPGGKVKVLDFGLAKAFAADQADVNLSNSPTLSMQATQQGVILGTAAYMSPEQARGEDADQRADVWAFGVVLFEMLTGRGTFEGRTVSDVLAAVLAKDPQWNSLPHNVHPRLRLLLERCLAKELKDRYTGVGDARVDVHTVLADPGGVLVQPIAEVVQATRQSKLPWVAVFVAGAIIAGMAVWVFMQPDPAQPVRLTAIHPGTEVVGNNFDVDVILSKDGRRIVYIAGGEQEGRLYVRDLDQLEPTLLAESARSPFLSPGDQWVGFMSSRTWMKVAMTGGPAVRVGEVGAAPRGATWGPDDTILFATDDNSTGLYGISASGGEAEVLTTPDSGTGELDHLFPEFLPGGRAVLFTITNNQGLGNSQIAVLDLESGNHRILIQGGSNPRYAASGHIVYGVGGTLRAVAFDLDSLETSGAAVPVLEGVATKETGAASFSVSPDGKLVYVAGSAFAASQRTLVWVNRDGELQPVGLPTGGYDYVRLSPDERRISVFLDGLRDIWIYEVDSGRATPLTSDGLSDEYSVWDPTSGLQLAYTSARGGNENVWIKQADGSGQPRQLTALEGEVDVDSWSPDGSTLSAHHHRPDGGVDVVMIPIDNGESEPQEFLRRNFNDTGAVFSPDGDWVAYVSNEGGPNNIYITSYPEAVGRQVVSVDGGNTPFWAQSGELFFVGAVDGVSTMMVVDATQPALALPPPRPLFPWPFLPPYAVTADGQRFLAISATPTEQGGAAQRQISVVLNWFEELKERVPVP